MKSRFARLLPRRLVVLVALILVILPGIPNTYSAEITLAWSPNGEPDLEGYKLFCREEGQSYNYDDPPIWQGTATTCTIADLDNDTRYCFVVRAFDSSQNESGDSNEACWQYSPAPPVLESLSIIGPDSVNESSTEYYRAEATFSNGDTMPATNGSIWTVHPSTYANFHDNNNVLTTLAVPSKQIVTIRAEFTFGDVTKADTMDVTIVNESGTDDSDDDGMPDTWEITHFGDLSHDGTADSDSDGLTDLEEYENDTNPNNRDTDGDGLPDGWEVDYDLDPNDPNDASYDSDDDGYTNLEEYKGGTSPNNHGSYPTRPYVIRDDCHPYDGQGIEQGSLRVPVDTSVVMRLKDDDGIDGGSIEMTVRGESVSPVLKQITEGDPADYWVVYRPEQDPFEYEQVVAVTLDVLDIDGIAMHTCTYSFKIESEDEHNTAEANTPSSTLDDSDPTQYVLSADSGTVIEGAKIMFDPDEPVRPRFGPTNEIPAIPGWDAPGLPLALEPPTVFENPVTIFIPCPGADEVSSLSVWYYNPAVGWMEAQESDGWMVPGSRVNHNYGTPSTIEIQVHHFSGVQAEFSATGDDGAGGDGGDTAAAPGGGGGGGGGGCLISTIASDSCSADSSSPKAIYLLLLLIVAWRLASIVFSTTRASSR